MRSSSKIFAQQIVDSMENYKYIIGQINGLEATKQELSNLLEPKEPNNDDPNNVTRIRS